MQPAITIRRASDLACDAALLSPAERAVMPPAGLRRDEWIRGRLALRSALVAALGPAAADIDIVVAPDAGPLLVGGPACAVSLSHDAGWIAVAVAPGSSRLGIDLCARTHAARVSELLRQLGVTYDCEAVVAWAALEAVLKLRRWPILELREHALSVVGRDATTVIVHGLGEAAVVALQASDDHVVGWAIEQVGSQPA